MTYLLQTMLPNNIPKLKAVIYNGIWSCNIRMSSLLIHEVYGFDTVEEALS